LGQCRLRNDFLSQERKTHCGDFEMDASWPPLLQHLGHGLQPTSCVDHARESLSTRYLRVQRLDVPDVAHDHTSFEQLWSPNSPEVYCKQEESELNLRLGFEPQWEVIWLEKEISLDTSRLWY
jgi:hypothetical protein